MQSGKNAESMDNSAVCGDGEKVSAGAAALGGPGAADKYAAYAFGCFLRGISGQYAALKSLRLPEAWEELCAAAGPSMLSVPAEEVMKSGLGCGQGNWRLAVLLGDPVAHSLSPALHNAFNCYDKTCKYIYLTAKAAVGELDEFLSRWAEELPFMCGFNVTHPYKEKVFSFLSAGGRVTEEAAAIGAVNTVFRGSDGGAFGDNTDWSGWLRSWNSRIGLPIKGRRAVVFGAGGAARAVIYALLRSGISGVTIINSKARACRLIEHFKELQKQGRLPEAGLMQADVSPGSYEPGTIFVQATPVGQNPDSGFSVYSWPASDFSSKTAVNREQGGITACDLVYNPRVSEFLRLSIPYAGKSMGGAGMLIWQAVYARERFACGNGLECFQPEDAFIEALERDIFA